MLVLAGCGSENAATSGAESSSESSPGATEESSPASSGSGMPACTEIWVAGAKFPGRYTGCLDGDAEVKADRHRCEFGTSIVEFDNRYYAVPGYPVQDVGDLRSSSQFRRALNNCQG